MNNAYNHSFHSDGKKPPRVKQGVITKKIQMTPEIKKHKEALENVWEFRGALALLRDDALIYGLKIVLGVKEQEKSKYAARGFTENQIWFIRRKLFTLSWYAAYFGVAGTTIKDIWNRKTYAWVNDDNGQSDINRYRSNTFRTRNPQLLFEYSHLPFQS